MSVLKFRNPETNEWQEITTIVGPSGPAGYTPVKGTDYFTEADKNEIVELVKEDLTNAGYQTEVQVNALISTALGNIGVAEEGAY